MCCENFRVSKKWKILETNKNVSLLDKKKFISKINFNK